MTDSSAKKKKKKKSRRERPPSEEDFALETKKRRKRLHSGDEDEDEVRKKRRRSEEAKESESESHSKIEKKKKIEDGRDCSEDEDKARQKRKKKKKRKRRQSQGEPYPPEIETATVDQPEKKKRRKHLHSNGDDKQPSIRDENESETEKKEKEARKTSPLDREDERRHLDIEECSEEEIISDETRRKRKKKKKKKRRRQQDEDGPHAEIETAERGQMISDQEQPEDDVRQQLVREGEEGNRARKKGIHLGRDAAIVIERMANTDALDDDDDDVLESEDEYAAIHQTTTAIIPPVEGVDRQKGEFTRKELNQIYHNIYRFCNQYRIADPTEIILQNRRDKNGKYSNELRKDFFQAAARHVPRTLHSIYRRLRRQFDEKHYGGRFTIDENRELASLKEKYGTDWGLIGEMMGRSGQSCLDRSRVQRGRRGMWSNEEEEALVVALREIAEERDDDLTTMSDKGLPWKAVSERVATRNFNQCRQKWLQNLRTIIVDRPERFRFVARDRARLIERVYEQYANEATARCDDIRWEEMGRSWEGGPVSRAILRRNWSNIVRLMPNYEVKSFEERVEYAYETTLPSIAAPRVLQNKESTT